jgi:hypothetical protein
MSRRTKWRPFDLEHERVPKTVMSPDVAERIHSHASTVYEPVKPSVCVSPISAVADGGDGMCSANDGGAGLPADILRSGGGAGARRVGAMRVGRRTWNGGRRRRGLACCGTCV